MPASPDPSPADMPVVDNEAVTYQTVEGVSAVMVQTAGSFQTVTIVAGTPFVTDDPFLIRELDGDPSVERVPAAPKTKDSKTS